MIDLDAIRKRDQDYNDIFEQQATMPKHIAHRLVAWPVADRRALLTEVDRLRDWQRRAVPQHKHAVQYCRCHGTGVLDGNDCYWCAENRALIEEVGHE